MTIKSQNDATYGRNKSIIFFPFELASYPIAGARRPFGWGKTPFVPQTVTARPILKKLLLKSNAEIFFVLLYLYIRNNKGRVAQNIRVKTPSGIGQNAHRSILPIKHWARCPTRVTIAKSIYKFLNVHK